MNANLNKYNADNIKVFEGLSAVRKRPAMYIGSTNSYGLHHLLWEIIDNSIDEILNGFGNIVTVTLISNKIICVEDNGRGIPIDINKKYKKPAANLIFEKLHSGGKFDSDSYKNSGGLHGVGAAVVNALSVHMDITIYRNNDVYTLKYENGGKLKQKLTKLSSPINHSGTKITFEPDEKIFKDYSFDSIIIKKTLRQKAYLNNNAKFIFKNEITNEMTEWYYKNGLYDYINSINKNYEELIEPIYHNKMIDKVNVEIIWTFINSEREVLLSFANSVETIEGGTHVTGFKFALTKTINDYAIDNNFIKKNSRFSFNDIKEGLIVIISVKVPENIIQFEGQTKTKLGSSEVRRITEHVFSNLLKKFLTENKEKATIIIKKILHNQKIRKTIKDTRDLLKKKKNLLSNKTLLSGKLVHCKSKKPAESELFLVEGDSAGGTAKSARNRKYQAILPLKGKILNVLRASNNVFIKNVEINTIINALECGIDDYFHFKKLRYEKVIIMTDADTDGAHIQTLLLTFFWLHMSNLITNNVLYIALAPLFRATYKANGKINYKYFWSEEKLNFAKKTQSFSHIQRYKGLGEMNANELWETTMDPNTRYLQQITIDDANKARKKIHILMGNDAEKRKKWIEENIDFTLEDTHGQF